ncbi:translation initiation factor IF-2-like [Coturnix japonica]|uniref:translation initiation factor IF-2-like n=1 Tax=Coturnix japonica TaxID=93934 RepID=UPI000776D42E|nr:translation initiation factor IF-2-like [Coturnix japonica]
MRPATGRRSGGRAEEQRGGGPAAGGPGAAAWGAPGRAGGGSEASGPGAAGETRAAPPPPTARDSSEALERSHGGPGNGIKQEETDGGFRHFSGEGGGGRRGQERRVPRKKARLAPARAPSRTAELASTAGRCAGIPATVGAAVTGGDGRTEEGGAAERPPTPPGGTPDGPSPRRAEVPPTGSGQVGRGRWPRNGGGLSAFFSSGARPPFCFGFAFPDVSGSLRLGEGSSSSAPGTRERWHRAGDGGPSVPAGARLPLAEARLTSRSRGGERGREGKGGGGCFPALKRRRRARSPASERDFPAPLARSPRHLLRHPAAERRPPAPPPRPAAAARAVPQVPSHTALPSMPRPRGGGGGELPCLRGCGSRVGGGAAPAPGA